MDYYPAGLREYQRGAALGGGRFASPDCLALSVVPLARKPYARPLSGEKELLND